MTKVTILAQESKRKELKKIEFKYLLTSDFEVSESTPGLDNYIEIVLLQKGYGSHNDGIKMDLMLAINEDKDTTLYWGHFNDGIV